MLKHCLRIVVHGSEIPMQEEVVTGTGGKFAVAGQ
jgi:hypothetical protein